MDKYLKGQVVISGIGGGAILTIIGGFGYLFYGADRYAKKQNQYIKETSPLCSEIMSNFDGNENGMIDPNEALELARAVGYQGIFSTNQPTVQLFSGDHKNQDVVLRMSGGSWCEDHRFPKSKLAELIRRPQHR